MKNLFDEETDLRYLISDELIEEFKKLGYEIEPQDFPMNTYRLSFENEEVYTDATRYIEFDIQKKNYSIRVYNFSGVGPEVTGITAKELELINKVIQELKECKKI